MSDLQSVFRSGSLEEIENALENSDETIVIDWRAEETELVRDVADHITDHTLSATVSDDGLRLLIAFDGSVTPVALSLSPRDRYITIRALNQIFAHQLELRLFVPWQYADTHVFMALELDRWAELEARNQIIREVFVKPDEHADFP
jgi:hypothetical protein